MTQAFFKYRAIATVQKGKISYILSPNSHFQGEVKLFDQPNDYKIFATFDLSEELAILKSLIFEKTFQIEQNYKSFCVEADRIIQIYFSRFKFIHREYSALIGAPDLIIDPDGTRISCLSGGIVTGGSVKGARSNLPSDCQQVGSDKKEVWDESIERYNDAMTFDDPVLRLIVLIGIVELIKNSEPNENIVREMQRKGLNDYNSIYYTRHLVAHGILVEKNGEKPIKFFRQVLNQPTATQFKFNRKDSKQMELVRSSVDQLSQGLSLYLTERLLAYK